MTFLKRCFERKFFFRIFLPLFNMYTYTVYTHVNKIAQMKKCYQNLLSYSLLVLVFWRLTPDDAFEHIVSFIISKPSYSDIEL